MVHHRRPVLDLVRRLRHPRFRGGRRDDYGGHAILVPRIELA